MPTDDRVHEVVEALMASVRQTIDAHLRSLTSDVVQLMTERDDRWRVELERAASDAREDAERTFLPRLDALREELTREIASGQLAPLADEPLPAPATTAAYVAPQESIDRLTRILGFVRRLDQATTLSGILEALAEGAATETSRVTILLREGDMLRVWGHFGFAASDVPVDLPIDQVRALTAAVAQGQTSFVQPAPDAREASSPTFMRVPAGHSGLVVPVVVGSEVVAVLYADDVDRLPEQEEAPVWSEEIELLVRHASLRLENVTSVRTVEVLTKAV